MIKSITRYANNRVGIELSESSDINVIGTDYGDGSVARVTGQIESLYELVDGEWTVVSGVAEAVEHLKQLYVAFGGDPEDVAGLTDLESLVTQLGEGTVTIPAGVAIPAYAYANNKFIRHVIIEDGITSIGGNAFWNCVNLETVQLPNTLSQLSNSEFKGCTSLKRIDFPDSMITIQGNAFQDCVSLEEVHLNNGLKNLKSAGFSYCSSLKSLEIPSTVTSIEGACFMHSGIERFTVNSSNTTYKSSEDGSILNKAGTSLVRASGSDGAYEVPSTVTTILMRALSGCNFEELTVPASVTTLPTSYAFSENPSLKKVTLNCPVTSLGSSALAENPQLVDVTLPTTLTTIGSYCFNKDYSLLSVLIPDSVRTIEGSAFAYCTDLQSISFPSGLQSIKSSAFMYCEALQSADIPNGVSLEGSIFMGCTSLSEVSLPDSLASIPQSLFSDCSALQQIQIPQTVTNISDKAFDKTGLTDVVIPSGVTKIGYAFRFCDSLSRVTMKASPTTMGSTAGASDTGSLRPFYKCEALTEVVFTEDVTSIPSMAFDKSITNPDAVVTILATSPTIGANAFRGMPSGSQIRCAFSSGAVSGAPWGATNATITYDYTPEPA